MVTIGKMASLMELSTDALRYYEREGLIQPTGKSPSGYRLYGNDSIRRIRFIKQAQHCGFTLAEIGQLLLLRASTSACCSDVHRVALEKKLQLEAKIKAMKSMSKALDHLIAECSDDHRPLEGCPILAAMDVVNGGKAKAVS